MITYPLLSQNCHESQFLTGIVQSRFPYLLFWICLGDFPQQCKENATTQLIYFTLWPFQLASDTFKDFQTLSNTFKHFQTLSGATRTDKSSQQLLPSKVRWLLSVYHNQCRRFEAVKYCLLNRKSSYSSCTNNTARFWVCCLVWVDLTRDSITQDGCLIVCCARLGHVTGANLFTNK